MHALYTHLLCKKLHTYWSEKAYCGKSLSSYFYRGDYQMNNSISTTFVVIAAIIFIVLAIFAYVRSRQGDQRMIATMNNLLLPLLSIIVITIGSIFSFHAS